MTAAIDEAVSANNGMPKSVGDYLKEAVEALGSEGEAADDHPGYLVLVESSGHRPAYTGGEEKCAVTKLWRGPMRRPTPAG